MTMLIDREINEKLYENRIEELKTSSHNTEDRYTAKVGRQGDRYHTLSCCGDTVAAATAVDDAYNDDDVICQVSELEKKLEVLILFNDQKEELERNMKVRTVRTVGYGLDARCCDDDHDGDEYNDYHGDVALRC